MRFLIKFPTRARPQQFRQALHLYRSMASGKHDLRFVVSCDGDDQKMNNPEMRQFLASLPNLSVHFGVNRTKVEAINADMNVCTDWEVVLLASDDMLVRCQGYDDVIAVQMQHHFPGLDGVLHFDDGFTADRLNTLAVMGKMYFLRFQYIYNPAYRSVWCDNEMDLVSRLLGKRVYVPRCIIQHAHPINLGKRKDKLLIKNESFSDRDKVIFENRKANGFGLGLKGTS